MRSTASMTAAHDAEDNAAFVRSRGNSRVSGSLLLGLAIYELFGRSDRSQKRRILGVSDVADTLDLPRGTAHRYLATLVRAGWLEQDEHRKYWVVA
jgi:hypothetical protein